MRQFHKVALLATLLAVSAICHAGIDDNKPLTMGKPVAGELRKGDGDDMYFDSYVFRGRKGQQVTITLETTGSFGAVPRFDLRHPNDGSHKEKKELGAEERFDARGEEDPLLSGAWFSDNNDRMVTDAKSGFLQKSIELKTNGEYRLRVIGHMEVENAMRHYAVPSSYRITIEEASSDTLVAPPSAEAVVPLAQRYFNSESEYAGTYAMTKVNSLSIYLTARDTADANAGFCVEPLAGNKNGITKGQCVDFRFVLKNSGGNWKVVEIAETYHKERMMQEQKARFEKARVPDFTLPAQSKNPAWTEIYKDRSATFYIDPSSIRIIKEPRRNKFVNF